MSHKLGPKPGDRVVRIPRRAELAPVDVHIEPRAVSVRGATSPMTLVYSFFGLILIGALLLWLPISNANHQFGNFVDAVFTATSAATGTGLVLFDTEEHWSFVGELALAALIFVGGLGFMTGAVVLIFLLGQRVGLQGQLLLSAGLGETQLAQISNLAKRIIFMAIAVQTIGAILIFVRWYAFGPAWPGLSLSDAIWQSVFTSISGFNNAGFDLIPDDLVGGQSLVGFGHDHITLAIIGSLIVLGSISYTTFSDALSKRKWSILRLDSKLVLSGVALMLVVGFTAFIAAEWSNPGTIGNDDINGKLTQGVFHSINRASGFSTFDYTNLAESDVPVTEALMFVGGATATTTAGIKVNTLMVIIFAGLATLKGKSRTNAFGREIVAQTVARAFTIAIVAVISIFMFEIALSVVQPELGMRSSLFEVISAFATTGWSVGATPHLNTGGELVVALAMFVGRFGPLTIALFMTGRSSDTNYRFPTERVRIG